MRRALLSLAAAGVLALGPAAHGQQPPLATVESRLAAVDIGDTFDVDRFGVRTSERMLAAYGYTPEEVARREVETLQLTARFGRKEVARKVLEGDRFDRAEGRAEAAKRDMDEVRDFVLADRRFVALDDDRPRPEVDGIDLAVDVPTYVDVVMFLGSRSVAAGVAGGVHACDADRSDLAFYTKDDTLRPCTADEAAIVRGRGGVIFWRRDVKSRLIVRATGDLETLKGLARGAEGYRVHLLCRFLDDVWDPRRGWYREDVLREKRYDTSKMTYLHNAVDTRTPPIHFQAEAPPGEADETPNAARTSLVGLVIVDRDKKVVGLIRPAREGDAAGPAPAGAGVLKR